MKKHMLVLLGLFGLTVPLHASIARIDALGGELVAPNYFNDTQNILINPAYINSNRDFVIMEWGQDKENSLRRPEGGIYKSLGALNYGIYLGHEVHLEERREVSPTPKFLSPNNAWEFTVGGDMGTEWGIAVKYAEAHTQTNSADHSNVKKSQNSMDVKMGTLIGPAEIYLQLNLFDSSYGGEDAKEKFKSKLGGILGGNYNFQNFIVHGRFDHSGYDYYQKGSGNLFQESTQNNFSVGIGYTIFLTEEAKVYIDLGLLDSNKSARERIASPDAANKKEHTIQLPLTLGVEAYVKEWLTLRGYIAQNLFSHQTSYDFKQRSLEHSTTVGAGTTIHLGNFKLDGLLGTINPNEVQARPGVLSTNQLLAKISTSYWF